MSEYIQPLTAFIGLLAGNATPSSSGLDQEIKASSLLGPLYRGAVYEESQVRFLFTRVLTSVEETALGLLVSSHEGEDIHASEAPEDFGGNSLINVTSINGIDFTTITSDTTTHISNESNPHGTSVGNLENGTLAELNAKITDATLDTSTDFRPPSAHGNRHSRTGNDPLTLQNLSSGSATSNQVLRSNGSGGWTLTPLPVVVTDHGALGGLSDDDHPQYLRSDGGRPLSGTLDGGGNNIVNVGTVDGVAISTQTASTNSHIANQANPHGTDLGNLGAGTLAELNAKVTNATLDDSSDPRDPNSHSSTHEAGGSDELTVQDLGSGSAQAGQIFVADGNGGVEVASVAGVDQIPVFSGYISSNQSTLTSAYTALPLNAENVKDASVFTHTGSSAEVTVLTAGLYLISAYCTVGMSNSNRSESTFRVTVNTGGGFVQVPGLLGIMYHRTANQNGNSAAASQGVTLPAGAILRIELRRNTGSSGTLFPVANGCGMFIKSLEGLRGPQGEPGVGTSLNVLVDSTSLGSFEELAFDASDFDISTPGSGRALVTAAPKVSLQTVSETTASQTSSSFVILQTLTAPSAGVYEIHWSGIVTASNSTTTFFKLFVNGVEQVGSEALFTQTAFVSSVVTLSISYLTDTITANSTISIRWRVDSGTGQVADRRLLVLER